MEVPRALLAAAASCEVKNAVTSMRASTCHPPPHMTHDMHVSSSSAGYQYACQHMSLACFIAPIHSLISRLRPLLAPLPPSPPCLPLGISLCSLRNFHILQPGAASISSSLVVPPNLGTVPALSQGPHSLPLLTIPVLLQAVPLAQPPH